MDYGPLGKTSTYLEGYDPSLLFPISRSSAREKVGITGVSDFGQDLWNAYEFSWLNSNGLPISKVLEISVKHSSAQVVESKSMKLYLNGLRNQILTKNLRCLRPFKETWRWRLMESCRSLSRSGWSLDPLLRKESRLI